MSDIVSENRLMFLHPKVRPAALSAYREAVKITPAGVHPYITETLRTFERSNALYNQPHDGKDNDGDGKVDEPDEKVTNAPGGSSFHNYGLAIDFVIQVNGIPKWGVNDNWMKVVKCFKEAGFVWGGDFKSIKDNPHFEMTFGYTWRQLLAKYKKKDFIPGTGYLNL
jgi:peptidoglycan L-alanyl-D-glutamate endopeptidase CwlK